MSLYFPSSTRAIRATGKRVSLLGLAVSMLLVAAWFLWFAQGTITLYQTSYPITLHLNDLTDADTPLVAATFPPSAFDFLDQGQDATLWLDNPTNNSPIAIPVQIYDIAPTFEQQPIHTTILIPSLPPLDYMPRKKVTAHVKIPSKQVHPITLFFTHFNGLDSSASLPNERPQ